MVLKWNLSCYPYASSQPGLASWSSICEVTQGFMLRRTLCSEGPVLVVMLFRCNLEVNFWTKGSIFPFFTGPSKFRTWYWPQLSSFPKGLLDDIQLYKNIVKRSSTLDFSVATKTSRDGGGMILLTKLRVIEIMRRLWSNTRPPPIIFQGFWRMCRMWKGYTPKGSNVWLLA